MMARTESRVACRNAASETVPGFSAALALSLSATGFSTAVQLPSRAETISPLAAIGQFGVFQVAPRAFCSTVEGSSARLAKKLAQSSFTDAGFVSYFAWR